MNPTLDQLVANARADELRWLERTASDRPPHPALPAPPRGARRAREQTGP